MEAFAKLLEAIAALIGVVAWPLVVLVLLRAFRQPIAAFLAGIGEFSLKGGGFEASARKQAQQAAAVAATLSESRKGSSAENIAHEAQLAVDIIGNAATSRMMRNARDISILWVDDSPDKNKYERESIGALGAKIDLASSTEEALKMLTAANYDFVISDMGRPGDREAGYTLLDALKERRINVPFAIYTAGVSKDDRRIAEGKGAIGITSKASELFEIVLSTLKRTGI